MASKANLSDAQKLLSKSLDIASQLCIDYAAKEVPALGNLTPEGLNEEFGRLNEARKAMGKTEKIVRGRLEAMLQGKTELRSDNFIYKKATSEVTRLNQEKAKEVLAEVGRLDECMDTTDQERVTVKRC